MPDHLEVAERRARKRAPRTATAATTDEQRDPAAACRRAEARRSTIGAAPYAPGDAADAHRRPPRASRRRRSRSQRRAPPPISGREQPAEEDARRRGRRARRRCPASTPIQYQVPTGPSVPPWHARPCRWAMIRPCAPRALRRLPRYPLEVFFWTRAADLGRRRSSPTSSSRPSTPSRSTPAAPRTSSSARRRLGDRRLGRAGTAAGSSGSPTTATPTRGTRPRSSRSTRCSSAGVGWFLLGHHLLAGVARLACRLGRRVRRCSGSSRSSSTQRGEPPTGRVLYLALFPTTLFLFAVYSESLYLLLSVGAFLLARAQAAGRWAGVAIGLAALTRVSGVILLPALAVLAWRRPEPRGALAPPRDLAADHGALAALPRPEVPPAVRVPHARSAPAGTGTCRPPGPLGGAWDALVAGWRGVRQLVAGSGHDYFPSPDHGAMYGAGLNLEQLAYAVLLVGARRLRVARARRRVRDLRAREPRAAVLRPGAEHAAPLDAAVRARRLPGLHRARDARRAATRWTPGCSVGFTLLLGINLARWVLWIWVA